MLFAGTWYSLRDSHSNMAQEMLPKAKLKETILVKEKKVKTRSLTSNGNSTTKEPENKEGSVAVSVKPSATAVGKVQNTLSGKQSSQKMSKSPEVHVESPLDKILTAISTLEQRQKQHEDRVNTMLGIPPGTTGLEENDYMYDNDHYQFESDHAEAREGEYFADSDMHDRSTPGSDHGQGVHDTNLALATGTRSSTLSEMARKYQRIEVCSHELDEGLAESINSIFREGLSEESLQSISKDISRPGNCPALCTVRVNDLIWKIISPQAQSRDRSFQNVQTHLVKGSTLLAQMLEHINGMNEGEDRTKLLQMGLDSLALLGHTNRQLINRRRETLRPEIQHDYGHLCSSSVPFTDKLFGDNVSQNVKDIQDIKRVERVITRKWRGRPQPYPSYPSRGRGQYQYGGFSGYPQGQFFQSRGKFVPRGRGYPRFRNSNWQRGQATVTRPAQKKDKSE